MSNDMNKMMDALGGLTGKNGDDTGSKDMLIGLTGKSGELSDMGKKLTEGLGGLDKAAQLQKVGPEGDTGKTAFDESEQAAKGKEIVGFVVRSGDIVDGICVLYSDGTKGPQHGSSTGGEEHTVRFDSGDTLVTIGGKKNVSFGGGNALAGLVFVTRKNKTYGPFGKRFKEGSAIRVAVPEGKTVKGLFGTVNGSGNSGFLAGIGVCCAE